MTNNFFRRDFKAQLNCVKTDELVFSGQDILNTLLEILDCKKASHKILKSQ